MKKTTILLCLACLFFASCDWLGKKNEISHFPFKESKRDNWGLVDDKGRVLYDDMFESSPTPVVNGIFFIDNWDDGETKIEMFSIDKPNTPIGGTYVEILPFHEKVTPCVKKGEGIKYIDKKGIVRFILPSKYCQAYAFSNGYSIIAKRSENDDYDYVYDAISTNGEIISFTKYTIMSAIGRNNFLVVEKDNTNKAHIVNRKGEIKYSLKDFPTEYLEPYPELVNQIFSPNLKYYIYMVDNAYNYCGIRSINGEIILKAKEERPMVFDSNGNLLFAQDESEEIGVMDIHGNILIKPQYKNMHSTGGGLYVAQKEKNDKYGLINEKGEELIPFDYYYMRPVSSRAVLVQEDNYDDDYILLDKNGRVLGEYAEFSSWEPFYVKSDYRD